MDESERAGPGNLHNSIRVETAPGGEDLARDDWSEHDQKIPPHALSGLQGQSCLAAVCGDKTLAELAQQHDVHPNQITDWKEPGGEWPKSRGHFRQKGGALRPH